MWGKSEEIKEGVGDGRKKGGVGYSKRRVIGRAVDEIGAGEGIAWVRGDGLLGKEWQAEKREEKGRKKGGKGEEKGRKKDVWGRKPLI